MTALRLGVIGMSPGNGHPYSWSAICNGYEPAAMEHCGFPAIPRYLEKQRFPDDALKDAKVTHVWTQDPALSRHIAQAARIEHVVDHFPDMIGAVDGVLLARDDASTHLEIARPFLQAGLPVYIDKPIALSRSEALRIFDMQTYPGQLFSCSALRYAEELRLDADTAEQIGPIRMVHGISPKYWDTYAVHVIEPLLLLVPGRGVLERTQVWRGSESVNVQLVFSNGFEALVTTAGSVNAPIALRVFGDRGWRDLVFRDAFPAFKKALEEFILGVRMRRDVVSREFMLEVVDVLELGKRERLQ